MSLLLLLLLFVYLRLLLNGGENSPASGAATFGLSAEKAKSKVSQACEMEGDDDFSTSFLSLFPVVVVVVVVVVSS